MRRVLVSLLLAGLCSCLISLDGLTVTYTRSSTTRTFLFNANVPIIVKKLIDSEGFDKEPKELTGFNPASFSLSGGKHWVSFAFEKRGCLLPLACVSSESLPEISIFDKGVSMNCEKLSFDGRLIRF